VKILGYDPLARDEVLRQRAVMIEMVDSLRECIDASDVVFITTPDPAFKDLRKDDFQRGKNPKTVVDFWRILKEELQDGPVKYIPAGITAKGEEGAEMLKSLWKE
jgi:UDP-glucose 6-dehydrogenase